VALARALYGDPVLVVLDEPDASIDQAGGQALLAAIQDLKQRARTLFVVTHRDALLAEMDAVMVMAEGRIKAFMPVADYLAQERGAAPAQDELQRVPAMSAP
jgi:ABC-type protease/lipase transport system fused ATPase/permease subunit